MYLLYFSFLVIFMGFYWTGQYSTGWREQTPQAVTQYVNTNYEAVCPVYGIHIYFTHFH